MPLLRSRQPRFEHDGNSSLPTTDHDDDEANKGKDTKSFFQRNKAQTIILSVFLCCIFMGKHTNNNQVRVRKTNNDASSAPPPVLLPLTTIVNNTITESESLKPKLSRRQQILEDCGPLCDLSRQSHIPDPYFGYFAETTAPIDCQRLFQSELVDKGQDDDDDGEASPPPKIVRSHFHHDHAIVMSF